MAILTDQQLITLDSGESALRQPFLKLVGEPGIFVNSLTRKLRLYPAVPAILNSTYGTVDFAELGKTRVEQIPEDIISFTGGNTATATFPVISGLTYEFLVPPVSEIGETLTKDPIITIDEEKGTLESSANFIGAIKASYTTTYNLIEYEPERLNFPIGTDVVPGFRGVNIQSGTVFAYYEGSLVTFDPQYDIGELESNYSIELYKVFSRVIVTQNGSYEYIENWPDNDSYPGGQQGPDPDEPWIVEERVHEFGYVRNSGRLSIDSFVRRAEQPFIGTFNYDFPYEVRSALDNVTDPQILALTQNIDFDAVNARLNSLYGVTI